MATIIIDGETREVPDGTSIMDACEDLGVMFVCRAGICGTCVITVTEGMENLEPKTEEEENMDLSDDQRLACQAIIKSGTVVATF
ncbi:MAG: (2Fe-2S)-binding protein [Candidatus Hydrogenedentes bacterium]|jgi:ferredoxin|nr:(2Fe-2S)-binding protein [Candidatus Hydrogenedentota bacterium]